MKACTKIVSSMAVLLFAGTALAQSNTGTGDLSFGNGTNTGINNTATGYEAMYYNTTGTLNTATGDAALYNNTISVLGLHVMRPPSFQSRYRA